MKSLIIGSIILMSVYGFAKTQEKTQFQKMLEENQGVKTKESTVVINGYKYRKIEIENKDYYISFKQPSDQSPILHCGKPSGYKTENLITGSLKLNKRKFMYINLLKESCIVKNGQVKKTVSLSPELGFFLPEDKNSIIKNKKLGILPGGMNFYGEF
jgi:hypothetical protein